MAMRAETDSPPSCCRQWRCFWIAVEMLLQMVATTTRGERRQWRLTVGVEGLVASGAKGFKLHCKCFNDTCAAPGKKLVPCVSTTSEDYQFRSWQRWIKSTQAVSDGPPQMDRSGFAVFVRSAVHSRTPRRTSKAL
jgi:hypothetical protein